MKKLKIVRVSTAKNASGQYCYQLLPQNGVVITADKVTVDGQAISCKVVNGRALFWSSAKNGQVNVPYSETITFREGTSRAGVVGMSPNIGNQMMDVADDAENTQQLLDSKGIKNDRLVNAVVDITFSSRHQAQKPVAVAPVSSTPAQPEQVTDEQLQNDLNNALQDEQPAMQDEQPAIVEPEETTAQ